MRRPVYVGCGAAAEPRDGAGGRRRLLLAGLAGAVGQPSGLGDSIMAEGKVVNKIGFILRYDFILG